MLTLKYNLNSCKKIFIQYIVNFMEDMVMMTFLHHCIQKETYFNHNIDPQTSKEIKVHMSN
jgi:hypothetical protein